MYTEERAKEIVEYFEQHGEAETLKKFKITSETLNRIKRQYKNGTQNSTKIGKDEFSYDEAENTATISSGKFSSKNTDRVKILDEFLKLCKVDLETWEVERYILNAWDVTMKGEDKLGRTYTNYQIKVWLKRKQPKIMMIGYENYIEQIPKYKITKFPKVKETGIALEMAIMDAHFGKLAWELETGRRNYDLDIAVKDYEYAVDKNLSWASFFNPEKVFFIVGHDLFHIDNIHGRTTKGDHDLDVDGRFPKIYEKAFETVTKCLYRCREVAPVEVIWIPGNHDYLSSMLLCYTLKEHFQNDKFMTIDINSDAGKISRKARLWGNLLVGWTHQINGRQGSWANELAQAFPDLWGRSVYREWHHGHRHKKNEVKTMPVMTEGGVLCRQLTALSPIDKWHFENLFTDAVPGGESFVWSKDMGIISNFTAWTKTGLENKINK